MGKSIKLFLILIVLLSILNNGCQKQPVAAFSLSKTTVFPGDKITATNHSNNGYSYKWTLASGNTYNSKDLEFNAATSIGERKVTLQAYSKNGKKMSEISNSYTVIDFYNKSYIGNYTGPATNDWFEPLSTVSLNGNDKISINNNAGTSLDFIVNSLTSATLVPKTIIVSATELLNFKSGSIVRNGNVLTISLVWDYTDSAIPSNNVYNIPSTDVITKI